MNDLIQICEERIEESRTFEIKTDLEKQQSGKSWRKKGELQPGERDDLAKEIVAFANTYGGLLIVGLKETSENPKRAQEPAEPLPRIFDLADRLRDAFSSVIQPPLRNLEVQAISERVDSDQGYLVVKVQSSIAAPHGYGTPPKCYIRRDDKSEPMDMREIQNVFWETRSKRERIDLEFQKLSSEFQEYAYPRVETVAGARVAFRFAAMLENAVEIQRLYSKLRAGDLFSTVVPTPLPETSSVAQNPFEASRWQPTPYGSEYLYSKSSGDGHSQVGVWKLDDSGMASIIGDVVFPADESVELQMFSIVAGWTLKLARTLAMISGANDAVAIFDCEFRSGVHGLSVYDPTNPGKKVKIENRISRRIRPLRIAFPDEDDACGIAEEKMLHCFGMSAPAGADVISAHSTLVHNP